MKFETIEHPIRWLFLLHVIGGSLALASFMIPLVSKKGGKLHVRAGWLYGYAMLTVGISALVITPWRAFFDPVRTSSSTAFATFLFFIAIFTLTALWQGLSVLKQKNRKAPNRSLVHIGPPILTVICGIGVQIIGWELQNSLLLVFPVLAYFVSKDQLEYWLRAPGQKMHWWFAHMDGMFTACIATITAFLVTAVPRIWPMPIFHSTLLWITPGLVLGTLLNRWTAFYRVKFGSSI